MKKWLLLIIFTLVLSQTAQAEGPVYYFLKVEGKADPLFDLSINGKTIMKGIPADKFNIPVHITRELKNGVNLMKVEYVSDPNESLTIILESREQKESLKSGQVIFTSPAGETQGNAVKKEIPFNVELTFIDESMFILSGTDRQSMKELIQDYYNAIGKKNKKKALAFFETAAREESAIYPEYAKLYLDTLETTLGRLFSSPEFRMEPLDLNGFMFKTHGKIATAQHADGTPVFQSNEAQVTEDIVTMEDGIEVHKKQKVKIKLDPESFSFKKYNGKWNFTFEY